MVGPLYISLKTSKLSLPFSRPWIPWMFLGWKFVVPWRCHHQSWQLPLEELVLLVFQNHCLTWLREICCWLVRQIDSTRDWWGKSESVSHIGNNMEQRDWQTLANNKCRTHCEELILATACSFSHSRLNCFPGTRKIIGCQIGLLCKWSPKLLHQSNTLILPWGDITICRRCLKDIETGKTHGVSSPHEGPLHNYTSNKHSQSTSEKARSAKEVRVPASWNWPKWKVALFGTVAPWIQLVNGRGQRQNQSFTPTNACEDKELLAKALRLSRAKSREQDANETQ